MRYRLRLLRRPAVLDAGLAALLAALSVLAVWQLIFPGASGEKLGFEFGSLASLHRHLLGYLIATFGELAVLPLRHRFPLAAFAVTLAMAAVHWLVLPVVPSPADLAVAVTVYTIATAKPRPVAAAVAVIGLLLAVGLDLLFAAGADPGGVGRKSLAGAWLVKPSSLIVPALVLAGAWIAGDSTRVRRAYVTEVERRAADAERDAGRQAELATAAERERITRELHDVIAHALSVMVIQAQGAGSALRRQRPAETSEALDTIVVTGRGALAETRRLLGVARRPAAADADADAQLAPQPGLGDLPALAARVRRAGTPVQLLVTGMIRALADGIELSAYRIIQEALTNTMKHGGPGAAAVVAVHHTGTELTVEVTDDGGHAVPVAPVGPSPRDNGPRDRPRGRGLTDAGGAGPAGRDHGHGLVGMAARVAMLGGELETGPGNSAGFRVRARLPVPGSPRRPASGGPEHCARDSAPAAPAETVE